MSGIQIDKIDIDEHIDDDTLDVYQFQSEQNANYGYLKKVGEFGEASDVLINEFQLSKTINCMMVSCLFNEEDIKNMQKECTFPMIKILLIKKVKKKKENIGKLYFNFHTFDHIKEKCDIFDLENKKLNGFFSVQYIDSTTKIRLDTIKIYQGNENMIEKLIECLKDKRIAQITKIKI